MFLLRHTQKSTDIVKGFTVTLYNWSAFAKGLDEFTNFLTLKICFNETDGKINVLLMKYRCSFYFSLRQCRLRKQNIQQRLKQNTKERILDIFKQDHEVFLKNKNECVY